MLLFQKYKLFFFSIHVYHLVNILKFKSLAVVSLGKEPNCTAQKGVRDWCYFSHPSFLLLFFILTQIKSGINHPGPKTDMHYHNSTLTHAAGTSTRKRPSKIFFTLYCLPVSVPVDKQSIENVLMHLFNEKDNIFG